MSLADAVITIPTAEFSSLNLGQAVLLLGYEWLKSADATPASRTRNTIAVPATAQELIDLFEHLERELDAGGFFFPPAKKDAMVRNIRAMILRAGLTDQEARTIRGMIVALVRNKYRGQKTDLGRMQSVTLVPVIGFVAGRACWRSLFATFALWRGKSKGCVAAGRRHRAFPAGHRRRHLLDDGPPGAGGARRTGPCARAMSTA